MACGPQLSLWFTLLSHGPPSVPTSHVLFPIPGWLLLNHSLRPHSLLRLAVPRSYHHLRLSHFHICLFSQPTETEFCFQLCPSTWITVAFSPACPKISHHTSPSKHSPGGVQSFSKMTNKPADADPFYGSRAGLVKTFPAKVQTVFSALQAFVETTQLCPCSQKAVLHKV